MALVIVGLGNPGKEYEKTRHNAGRAAVELLAKQEGFDAFAFNKTANALVAKGKVGKEAATLVLPETMMNLSGKAAAAFVKSPKAAKDLLVVHDANARRPPARAHTGRGNVMATARARP